LRAISTRDSFSDVARRNGVETERVQEVVDSLRFKSKIKNNDIKSTLWYDPTYYSLPSHQFNTTQVKVKARVERKCLPLPLTNRSLLTFPKILL